MTVSKNITSRVWELVTDLKDEKGNEYINLDKMQEIIDNKIIGEDKKGGSIKRWAWIVHDKDKLEDGSPRAEHVHAVMEFTYAQDLERLTNWFGIPSNFFDKAYGRGAFLDKVEYLTHEDEKQQMKGKHLYSNNEVYSNFDWRAEVDLVKKKRLENLEKYGKSRLSDKDSIRLDVFYGRKTLKQVREEHPLQWMDDRVALLKARADYLFDLEPPKMRMNLYVDGAARIGKDQTSKGIARSWFPDLPDDECFFVVGAKNVAFEGYDGQPVIIWSDRRAYNFIEEFGRENVFAGIFNTFPTARVTQNVKYSSVTLPNVVNIVNGIEPYTKFLDGLAGEYTDKFGTKHASEDKDQAYGRFPMIIPVRQNDFDILLNKGYVADDSGAFQEYYLYKNVVGNMKNISTLCNGREYLLQELEKKLLSPVTDTGQKMLDNKMTKGAELSDDEIRDLFSDYGSFYSEKDLRDEYENVFLKRWAEVNPHVSISRVINFEDWLKHGKPNAYNYKEKRWERVSFDYITPTTLTRSDDFY